MKPKSSPISLPELVLLALLALVPVVFSRMTQECFEVPQSSVLATGAIVLFSLGLAQELGRATREGVGSYLATSGARLSSWAVRDPLGIGVLLYLASAFASTVTAPNPWQSVHGASDSTAGLVTPLPPPVVLFLSPAPSRGNPPGLIPFAPAA